eukprot:5830446-Amphidinium_carterae.1
MPTRWNRWLELVFLRRELRFHRRESMLELEFFRAKIGLGRLGANSRHEAQLKISKPARSMARSMYTAQRLLGAASPELFSS